jgi:flagellar biosynthesis protein FlhF
MSATRKFVAETSRDALQMVRSALGEEAVILSNRRVDNGIEIVAMSNSELATLTEPKPAVPPQVTRSARQAVAEPVQKIAAASSSSEQQRILMEIKSMRSLMQEQLACLASPEMPWRDPARSGMWNTLVDAGFGAALSRQLLEKMPMGAGMGWLKQVLEHNLRVAGPAEDLITHGGVYALVGPTGVGKTTTTAKLAARAVVRFGAENVGLLTTDTYRVGAYEQLRIYGNILGIAVHAVRDADDLQRTLSAFEHKHLILIDTMGVGQRDSRVSEQSAMFDAAGVRRLLLLNATSNSETLQDVIHLYGGNGVVGCIPTKMDEAATLGSVLGAMMQHRLPMHYVANGQRVPEDLQEANVKSLLFKAFEQSSRSPDSAMRELDIPELPFMAAAPAAWGECAA